MPTIETDLVQQSPSGARQAVAVIAVNPDGSPISGGGGSGPSEVEVTNFPSSQPVTGPLTNAQFTAVTGAASAAAWDGNAASATIVSILKSLHDQNILIMSLLEDIVANTTPPEPDA